MDKPDCYQLSHDSQNTAEQWQQIDELGEASRIVQKLKNPLTSSALFRSSNETISASTHVFRLYVIRKSMEQPILGYIKVGQKHIFYQDDDLGKMVEIDPICVLDFFVDPPMQRQGYGKQLFEFMLLQEKEAPHQLAYDRPSDKFIQFLDHHYHLQSYTPQFTNFVIFKDYFK